MDALSWKSPLTCLSFSHRLLAVGGQDVLCLSVVQHLTSTPSFSAPIDVPTANKRISHCSLNLLNDHLLASATTRGDVEIFNVAIVSKVESLPSSSRAHTSAVNKTSWSPTDANCLVTASSDGTLHLMDVRLRDFITCTLQPKSREVRDAVFSPHEPFTIAACFSNGTVKVFDSRRPKHCLHDLLAHDGMAMSLAYHPRRRGLLASGGSSAREGAQNLKILELESTKRPIQLRTPGGVTGLGWRPEHDAHLGAVVSDMDVMVWDVDNWPSVALASFDSSNVTAFGWAGAEHVVSCGKDGKVRVHAVGEARHPIEAGSRGRVMALSPQGTLVLGLGRVERGLGARLLAGKSSKPRRVGLEERVLGKTPRLDELARAYVYAGCDLKQGLRHNGGLRGAVPGLWASLAALLCPEQPEAGPARRAAAREVPESPSWWSASSLRLLRELQAVDPLEQALRPVAPVAVALVRELQTALEPARPAGDWVELNVPSAMGNMGFDQRLEVARRGLEALVDEGQLQSAVVASLLFRAHGLDLAPRPLLASWVDAYCDVLRRLGLFVEAKDVLVAWGVGGGDLVASMCLDCDKGSRCRCARPPVSCAGM